MNVVLDTNVLVAGLLSPFGPCGEIMRMVSSGDLSLSFDARLLAEYEEVLCRPKFAFDKGRVTDLLEHIENCGRFVASTPLDQALPDPDDEPFLEVAVAARAEALVTGNRAHFPPSRIAGVRICSPSEFLTHYRAHKVRRAR